MKNHSLRGSSGPLYQYTSIRLVAYFNTSSQIQLEEQKNRCQETFEE